MIRRFSKLLRVAGTICLVALLSLSGELNILGLEIGSAVPTAKATNTGVNGHTVIANGKLKYRESDGQFLAAGENGAFTAIFVENVGGGAVCGEAKIGTRTNTSQLARLATDASGNVYVVYQDKDPAYNVGYQAFLAVLDPNCNQVAGSPFNLGGLLHTQYGVDLSNGYPDVTYSPSENRIYISMQDFNNGGVRINAFSAVAGLSGWGSGAKWDRFWPLVNNNGSCKTYPRIAIDKNLRGHITFARRVGNNCGMRAIDLTGGANGSWNVYGGTGLDISNNPNSDVPQDNKEIGMADDGTTYATYVSPGNGPLSVGMNKFDPTTGSWGTGRDNVIGTSSGDYNTLHSAGLGVGHTRGVYIGVGIDPAYAKIYTSSDKGQTFPANLRKSFGPGAGPFTPLVSIAEGNNIVGVFWQDGDKNNYFNTFTGVETPPLITKITAPTSGSTVTIPAGQPTTSITVSWQKVSGGVGGLPITYTVDYLDTTNPVWVNLATTTATSTTLTIAGNRSYAFRVRGDEGPSGSTESVHANADSIISVVYGHFTSVDVVMDANGYYAPTPIPSTQPDVNGVVGLAYYPLPKPIRLLDTRAGTAAYYTPGAPINAGSSVNYKMAGITYAAAGNITIPPQAVALSGTATVVNPSAPGFLTTYPGGAAIPLSATMNYSTNILANNASLTLGDPNGANAGQLNIYSWQKTDVVLDVTGYYAPVGTADPNSISSGLLYYPLPKPIRLLDTRPGLAAYYTPGAPINAGSSVNYKMAGITYAAAGNITIPPQAVALSGTATVVNPSAPGFLTTYPGGAAIPLSATMNYSTNILANNASLTLGDPNGANAGQLNIYSWQKTDLIVDVTGYYAPVGTADPNGASNGLIYFPLPKPTRLLDTRQGTTAYYTPGTPSNAGNPSNYQVAGINYTALNVQIPSNAQAVDVNLTVVVPNPSNGEGYLTGYPGPNGATPPLISTIYYYANNILSNSSILTVGGGGNNTINILTMAF